jgi:Kef-type K+ transport system membrane component KefB
VNEATLLALAAAGGVAAAQWSRLPAVPILVLLGFAISWLPGSEGLRVDGEVPTLALAYLVFAAGLELEPARLVGNLATALRVGVAQFVVVGCLGTLVASGLGVDAAAAATIGIGIAGSSTIVGVRLLIERGQLGEAFGRVVLGVLLLQDLLMMLALAAIGSLGVDGVPFTASPLVGIALLIAGHAVLRRLGPRWIGGHDDRPPLMILIASSVLFAFVGIAYYTGLPLVVGAFAAGVSLSAFPVGGMIRAPIASIGIFVSAIFFVALGGSIETPTLRDVLVAGSLLAVVVLATPVVVAVTALRSGLARRESIEAGLLLAQCGELTLVLAVLGLGLGILDQASFSALSLVTVASMMITPLLATDRFAWWLTRRLPRRPLEAVPPIENHVVLLGCGRNSEVLLEMLRVAEVPLVVVDRDPGIVERLRERGIESICGEGSDPEVLRATRASRARAVVSTMRRVADNVRLLRRVDLEDGPLVVVRAFFDADTARLSRLGAEVVSEAEVGAAETVLVARGILAATRARPRATQSS